MSKIHTIYHGTFDYFTKWRKENKKQLKKKFGVNGKEVVLFFGYIRKYKGLLYLIKALPKVLKKRKNVVLVIAGELWEKWNTYEKEIKKLNLEPFVKIFPNYVPDKNVHKFFDIADICVLPYHNTEQTISGPLLVSLAFGKPTIVSDVGGISETVGHKKEAILVKGGNVNILAENIIKLLGDAKLSKKLSKNAKLSTKDLSWNKVALQYKQVYEKARR